MWGSRKEGVTIHERLSSTVPRALNMLNMSFVVRFTISPFLFDFWSRQLVTKDIQPTREGSRRQEARNQAGGSSESCTRLVTVSANVAGTGSGVMVVQVLDELDLGKLMMLIYQVIFEFYTTDSSCHSSWLSSMQSGASREFHVSQFIFSIFVPVEIHRHLALQHEAMLSADFCMLLLAVCFAGVCFDGQAH